MSEITGVFRKKQLEKRVLSLFGGLKLGGRATPNDLVEGLTMRSSKLPEKGKPVHRGTHCVTPRIGFRTTFEPPWLKPREKLPAINAGGIIGSLMQSPRKQKLIPKFRSPSLHLGTKFAMLNVDSVQVNHFMGHFPARKQNCMVRTALYLSLFDLDKEFAHSSRLRR